jgi:subtilase family serine protease
MLVAQEVSEHQLSPLSRSQVLSLFAPSQEEFDAIVNFLKESGFTITYLSPDRL